jgi:hypothetical protein
MHPATAWPMVTLVVIRAQSAGGEPRDRAEQRFWPFGQLSQTHSPAPIGARCAYDLFFLRVGTAR